MGAWGSARSGRGRTPGVFAWIVRLAFGGVGLFCLAHGGIDIISHVAYSLNGQRTEASLVSQRTVCQLEYQLSNESDLRRDPMSCEAAEAAAKANAGRQVRVVRDTVARLRFTLANGKVREEEATVSASNRLSPAMAAGTTVSIIYMETNPADLRIALNAARIAELMLLMGVGILVLMFAFFGSGDRVSRSQKVTIRGGVSSTS
jgi:hypothetical protein